MEWWSAIGPTAAVLAVAFLSPFIFDTPRRRARARLRSDAEVLSHMDPGPGRDELSAHVDQQARELVAREQAKGADGAGEVVALVGILAFGIAEVVLFFLPVPDDSPWRVGGFMLAAGLFMIVLASVMLWTVVPQVRARRRPKPLPPSDDTPPVHP